MHIDLKTDGFNMHRRKTWTIVIFLSVVTLTIGKERWQVVWEEDFLGTKDLPETFNFDVGCGGWGNNELQCYTRNRRENVRQEGGLLIITAKREPWKDGETGLQRDFTSSRMITKQNWTYGRFEIKARLPKGKHLWPAIWMLPANSDYYGIWPASGEIDIVEYRGQKPNETTGTIHYGQQWNHKGQSGYPARVFDIDFSQEFHIFRLDWTPSEISWWLDGERLHAETLNRNIFPNFYNKSGQPFDRPFCILVNIAVGGDFFGGESFHPEEATQWAKPTLEIDWIKVYQNEVGNYANPSWTAFRATSLVSVLFSLYTFYVFVL